MGFTRSGTIPHSRTTGKTATDHHTATVAGDLQLSGLAGRAHTDLSDAPTDAHHDEDHGVGQHTNRTVTLHVPVSGALASSTLINSFNRPIINVADGVDGHGVCGLKVPTDFVSFTRIDMVWVTAATSKVAVIDPQAIFAASGEDTNGTTETPSDVTPTSSSTAQGLNVTNLGHTLGALAVGDYLGVRVRRLGSSGSDTLADAMRIIGIDFVYVASQ